MAGLYFHIPFCKTRCVYCDFYSATCLAGKSTLIDAMCREMEIRKNYLKGEKICTIYFGGGTPSLLASEDFERIFTKIHSLFNTKKCEEITIEANPDDLSEEYLVMLRGFQFNRISIGVQSFNDKELCFLNRRHTATQAIKAVESCRQAGFNNISIDLMYGLPTQTLETWQNSLQAAIDLNVEHISAYHLTYEPETTLGKMLANGKVTPANEDAGLAQFSTLINTLTNNGFEHYEISNFAQKGCRSKHNSSYWSGKSYLGIGPSAHSYDGHSRQWNIADTEQYIHTIKKLHSELDSESLICEVDEVLEATYFEREELSLTDQYNDYIITALRTAEGIDLSEINRKFGKKFTDYCQKKVQPFLQSGKLTQINVQIKTTMQGIFISDYIMEELMFV